MYNLSAVEAAARAGMTYPHFIAHYKEWRIPHARLGVRPFFRGEDIDTFLAARRNPSLPEAKEYKTAPINYG
jgi:hypothetical protein